MLDNLYVHSGKFHSDDAVCAALIRMINPNIRIIRTRDVTNATDGICCDVGCGIFDHHCDQADWHDGFGTKGCAATRLWFFGQLDSVFFDTEEEAMKFYQRILRPVAIYDTEKKAEPGFLFQFVELFYFDDENADAAFEKVVGMVQAILEAEIRKIKRETEDALELTRLPKDKEIVVFDRYLQGYGQYLSANTAAHFFVYPASDGWHVSPISDYDWDIGLVNRTPFPSEWLDPDGSWPIGLTFCNKQGFLAVFENIFDALKALNDLMGIEEEEEEEEDPTEAFALEWLASRRKRSKRRLHRRIRRALVKK